MYLQLLFIALLASVLLYILAGTLKKITKYFIGTITSVPVGFRTQIIPGILAMIRTNWYVFITIILTWALLFLTEPGRDIVELWLDNLAEYSYFSKCASLLSVFSCTLLMSLSIWAIPYYLFSKERKDQIFLKPVPFYTETKLTSLASMMPFLLVANRIVSFEPMTDIHLAKIVIGNLVCFPLFLLFVRFFAFVGMHEVLELLLPFLKKIANTYIYILLKIFIWILLLTIFCGLLEGVCGRFIVGLYLFISSAIVFKLLFYSRDVNDTSENIIHRRVAAILVEKNVKNSKIFYRALLMITMLIIIYYYLVPSLEPTSALYIMLVVFSFFILFFDYWKYVYQNKKGFAKCLSIVIPAAFLAAPFINPKGQFRVNLIEAKIPDSLNYSLETAIQNRLNYIDSKSAGGKIFIVCAMGGGSRAGFITAGVLRVLDSIHPDFKDHVLCYSTVSGGSVGLYTYLKGMDQSILSKDTNFLNNVYRKNYNSSGIFGLLIGDGIETMLGPIATRFKALLNKDTAAPVFYDRNFRIREEYNIVLNQALKNKVKTNYLSATFPSPADYSSTDSFRTYFIRENGAKPIHLINTFEISSGKRAVLSPFPSSPSFFLNTILPLQDSEFGSSNLKKDMLYREAVNMSELFPLVSAASHIDTAKSQFVDGGYYENYGLATALDVYAFLGINYQSRVKVLLIKNSKQEAEVSVEQAQYLAPVVGALRAPFTGHANHLLEETRRHLGYQNVFETIFDADVAKVPLSRTLTRRHVAVMNSYLQKLYTDKALENFTAP